MACRRDKSRYVTYDAALDAQKKLVYDNFLRKKDARSAGLNVYACDECGGWHIGHSSLRTPTAYHYGVLTELEAILKDDGLVPAKPRRLPTHLRRQNTGRMLALLKSLEERDPMVWFSWNANWDFTGIPHPGTFVPRARDEPASARMHEGILRIAVSASVVKLRWSDYLQSNKTMRVMRKAIEELGYAADWLATDQPVPCPFRSFDVWYRDRWADVGTLDDGFEAWLAEPPD